MSRWVFSLVAIVLMVFAPIIPLLIAVALGVQLHENSAVGVLPWLLFYTVPVGSLLLLIWLAAAVVKLIRG